MQKWFVAELEHKYGHFTFLIGVEEEEENCSWLQYVLLYSYKHTGLKKLPEKV